MGWSTAMQSMACSAVKCKAPKHQAQRIWEVSEAQARGAQRVVVVPSSEVLKAPWTAWSSEGSTSLWQKIGTG